MEPEPRPSVRVSIRRRELLVYRSRGLIGDGGLDDEDLLRHVRRIRRLRRDLGLSYEAIGVVLPLLERIERLEARTGRQAEG